MNHKKIHVPVDRDSRLNKARKIELLIRQMTTVESGKFLEVGCGSGYITKYFSDFGFGENGTFGVDVADNRQVMEGFSFTKVSDTMLPYDDNQFDLVVSNHVIEHVGDYSEQDNHLKEINRVLKPGGIFYFSVPNKWTLIEPHYRLPFLSWLSAQTAAKYVKFFKKGYEYDCNLLSEKTCKDLLDNNNFEYSNISIDAVRAYASVEGGLIATLLANSPRKLLKVLNPIMPTFIFLCEKK